MSVSQENSLPNDETDLVELIATLWDRKFVVLAATLIFTLLGVLYLLVTPGKYVGEFVLRGPTGAQLASYAPLNDEVKEHYEESEDSSDETNQFEISTASLERDIVRELQDYGEFEQALKENVPAIRDMSEEAFEDARAGLYSKLKITAPTERLPIGTVELEWSDENQLLGILQRTLALAEQNLNADKLASFNGLADNIERRNLAETRKLERALLSAKETADLEKESRLLFLSEQAAIARALDIADNDLANSAQDNQVALNMSFAQDEDQEIDQQRNLSPKAIYLRGYKSLEKEHALLSARTDEQNYILNPYFLELKHHAIELKNDGAVEQFREAIAMSPFTSGTKTFNASKETIWVEDKRNAALILVVAFLFGAIMGSIFVLVQNAVLRHRGGDLVS